MESNPIAALVELTMKFSPEKVKEVIERLKKI
jgi:hypothetical protein